MTTTIYVIRHGQTESNIAGFNMGRSDEGLNEAGKEHVRRLSYRMADFPIVSIYTSPLRRAHSTAVALAEPHMLEPVAINDLTEIDMGEWQGLHVNEIKRRWPELLQQWRTDPSEVTIPGGESLREVARRAISALNVIEENSRGKQAVIVTHEVVVKVIVTHVLETSNSKYHNFKVSNSSLTVIEFVDSKPRLIRLNDTSHLEVRDGVH